MTWCVDLHRWRLVSGLLWGKLAYFSDQTVFLPSLYYYTLYCAVCHICVPQDPPLHDADLGQPCRQCGEDCPGFMQHVWRWVNAHPESSSFVDDALWKYINVFVAVHIAEVCYLWNIPYNYFTRHTYTVKGPGLFQLSLVNSESMHSKYYSVQLKSGVDQDHGIP